MSIMSTDIVLSEDWF